MLFALITGISLNYITPVNIKFFYELFWLIHYTTAPRLAYAIAVSVYFVTF